MTVSSRYARPNDITADHARSTNSEMPYLEHDDSGLLQAITSRRGIAPCRDDQSICCLVNDSISKKQQVIGFMCSVSMMVIEGWLEYKVVCEDPMKRNHLVLSRAVAHVVYRDRTLVLPFGSLCPMPMLKHNAR
ncbi:MAG: hypothetical protein U0T81_03765 [Saprospiraceae bacterium]